MGVHKDITGEIFGDLTVTGLSHKENGKTYWNCKCKCGNERVIPLSNLLNGSTKTCARNRFYKENDYMVCATHSGFKFLFDSDDFELVSKYVWCNSAGGYASAHVKSSKKEIISMHRLVTGISTEEFVDHINLDKSDNRKSNLRLCTISENNRNRPKNKNGKSKFKGVSISIKTNRIIAAITFNRKSIYIGCYKNEIDAAKAYNEMALKLFGEFANINKL